MDDLLVRLFHQGFAARAAIASHAGTALALVGGGRRRGGAIVAEHDEAGRRFAAAASPRCGWTAESRRCFAALGLKTVGALLALPRAPAGAALRRRISSPASTRRSAARRRADLAAPAGAGPDRRAAAGRADRPDRRRRAHPAAARRAAEGAIWSGAASGARQLELSRCSASTARSTGWWSAPRGRCASPPPSSAPVPRAHEGRSATSSTPASASISSSSPSTPSRADAGPADRSVRRDRRRATPSARLVDRLGARLGDGQRPAARRRRQPSARARPSAGRPMAAALGRACKAGSGRRATDGRRGRCGCCASRSRSRRRSRCRTVRRCASAGAARCYGCAAPRGRSASPANGGATPRTAAGRATITASRTRPAAASGCSARALYGRDPDLRAGRRPLVPARHVRMRTSPIASPGLCRARRRQLNFSFLRGASHPEELVVTAPAPGPAGLGIADRNTLAGVVRAHWRRRRRASPMRPAPGWSSPTARPTSSPIRATAPARAGSAAC